MAMRNRSIGGRITAALLAAVCLIALLAGCAAPGRREAVQQLQCVRPEALSALRSAGDGRVLLVWADYEQGRTTVQLLDTERDALAREVTLEGVWDLKEQSFADGGFALCDRESNTWKLLDGALAEKGTLTAENVDGWFSYDGAAYYFLRDGVLLRQAVAGGAAEPVALSPELRFLELTAYDAESGRMAALFLLSPYGSECGTAIFDPATGEFTLLRKERYQVSFSGEELCLLRFDEEKMGYSALFGGGDTFRFADAALFSETGGDLYAIPGSPYLMGVETGRSVLYRAGENIESWALTDSGIGGEMYSCCWLKETGLLVGAVYREGAFRLYAVDPAQLAFRTAAESVPADMSVMVDTSAAQFYWDTAAGLPVAENLQEARQQADELERQYGVRILLSSQCREAAALCDRAITLTDTLSADEELAGVQRGLESLRRSLRLYPEGFPAQFRNSAGEGGLLFLLVAAIESDYGVVGCTYEGAGWQYIALDVCNTMDMDSITCHEIWHATENHILSQDYMAFDWDAWQALNPEGFLYSGDGTLQDPAQAGILYTAPIEDVYFVDSYGCVAATEDRARIMEFFMAHDDDAAQLIRSPHIRQKLQWMCDRVRRSFDTTGWGTPRWERLL